MNVVDPCLHQEIKTVHEEFVVEWTQCGENFGIRSSVCESELSEGCY